MIPFIPLTVTDPEFCLTSGVSYCMVSLARGPSPSAVQHFFLQADQKKGRSWEPEAPHGSLLASLRTGVWESLRSRLWGESDGHRLIQARSMLQEANLGSAHVRKGKTNTP